MGDAAHLITPMWAVVEAARAYRKRQTGSVPAMHVGNWTPSPALKRFLVSRWDARTTPVCGSTRCSTPEPSRTSPRNCTSGAVGRPLPA